MPWIAGRGGCDGPERRNAQGYPRILERGVETASTQGPWWARKGRFRAFISPEGPQTLAGGAGSIAMSSKGS